MPPFVISPENRYYYLDSGSSGDAMLEHIVRKSGKHLNEGGYCQVMCEIAHFRGHDWRERVANWVKGTGCDAWMLYRSTVSPVEHARMWVTDRTESSVDERMREWTDYYHQQGIEAVSSGLLTLRRSGAQDNWFQVDQVPNGNGYCGASIERVFEANDFLRQANTDKLLLGSRLQVSPDAQLHRRRRTTPDGSDVEDFTLHLTHGLMFAEVLDRATVSFIQNCNGKMTVDDAIRETERTTGQTLNASTLLPALRRLISNGLMLAC
jgi:hypothetical protein